MFQSHNSGNWNIVSFQPQPYGMGFVCDGQWEVSAGDGVLIPSLVYLSIVFPCKMGIQSTEKERWWTSLQSIMDKRHKWTGGSADNW